MNKFSKVQGILHLIAITLSAVVSAWASATNGGDPMMGAAIGASVNTLVGAANV